MKHRKWILLAEDNVHDADLALRALTSGGTPPDVVVANDGSEVLDCLHQRDTFNARAEGLPALVLLDLKMPKLDGLEVLRQMKTDPRLKTIPVVVFTSSREQADLVSSYRLGANAYVVKPMDFTQFVATLNDVATFWMAINEPPPEGPVTGDSRAAPIATAA